MDMNEQEEAIHKLNAHGLPPYVIQKLGSHTFAVLKRKGTLYEKMFETQLWSTAIETCYSLTKVALDD